ncbi:ComF family protein [Luteibacter aegosomatissinici]|nr:ComF family protein [Luteibacter aegosomatissinici]UPG94242.1 ComF family protein [Luteibacter aegosomatissinici]
MDVRTTLAHIARLFMPPRCLLCGAAGHEGIELCAPCGASLERNTSQCRRCALPLARTADLCLECTKETRPWHSIWVPYRYAWPLDLLETRFKFGGSLVAGNVLSRQWIAAGAPPQLPELIVPVPLHTARLRERGFNQALELVRPLARHIHVPVCARVLERTRPTNAQSGLDAEQRAENVRRAFRVRDVPAVKHVAVVDDVMTTGATLAACTLALLEAGVERVDVWALARTPKPDFKAKAG